MRDARGASGVKDGRRRRSWADDEKRRIVAESREEGTSIAEVARRYDLNANLLFTWRRQLSPSLAAGAAMTPMLPVTISPVAAPPTTGSGAAGRMEIVLADGERIIVWADVEATALTRILKALARR